MHLSMQSPTIPLPGKGGDLPLWGCKRPTPGAKLFGQSPTNSLLPPCYLYIYIKKISMQMQEGNENKLVKKQELIATLHSYLHPLQKNYCGSCVIPIYRPSETIRSIACTTVNNFFLTLLIIRRLQLDSFLRIILSCCSLSFPSFSSFSSSPLSVFVNFKKEYCFCN